MYGWMEDASACTDHVGHQADLGGYFDRNNKGGPSVRP